MIRKQEILEDFWDNFPQYKEMTPTYEDIKFEEEELIGWNQFWLEKIYESLNTQFDYVTTLYELEEILKFK